LPSFEVIAWSSLAEGRRTDVVHDPPSDAHDAETGGEAPLGRKERRV
jgi:hypothetical protein